MFVLLLRQKVQGNLFTLVISVSQTRVRRLAHSTVAAELHRPVLFLISWMICETQQGIQALTNCHLDLPASRSEEPLPSSLHADYGAPDADLEAAAYSNGKIVVRYGGEQECRRGRRLQFRRRARHRDKHQASAAFR